jgi:ABC-type uncharacterized transport system permease subunit
VDVTLQLLKTLLPMLYLAAVAAYVTDFVKGDPAAIRAARRLMEVTLTCHLLYLGLRTVHEQHVPLTGAPELMSMVALSAAFVYVVVERFTGVERTGAFMVVFPFLLQTFASAFVVEHQPFPALLRSPLFALHTVAAVLGYVALGVSAVYGVMFLLLHRELKGGRFGTIFNRLPPLESLARMNRRAAAIGVVFLAVTIAGGTLWASREFPGFTSDPKFLITVSIWAIYLLALVLHAVARWNSRRTVGLSLAGFALLLVSMLATRLLPSFHAFR